jgi:replicative DNA helicase
MTQVSSELLDRLPPQNLDAEQNLLGSILLDPRMCDDVALVVTVEDFYADANRKLYGHILAMHNDGKRIDLVLLAERLKREGDFESIGGGAYLAEAVNSVAVAAHAVHYAEIVYEKSVQRSMIECGTDLVRRGFEPGVDVSATLQHCEQAIYAVRDRQARDTVSTMTDVLMRAMTEIDGRKDRGSATGIFTGYNDLDNMLGGMRDGELIILAARPSMGKTALALNIAQYISQKSEVPTLFASLEMGELELAERLLSATADVNSHRLRNGWLNDEERQRIVEASSRLSLAPLLIDDTAARTVADIAAVARRAQRNADLGLIIVDYLQLITPANSRDPRQEQVAKISRQLKGLARELSLPILCVAQLNRESDKVGARPRLSNLRESGAIEQDADVVMFVHRDEYYFPDNDEHKGKADLLVRKQRNGPTGDIKLTWRKEFARFESAAKDQQQGAF